MNVTAVCLLLVPVLLVCTCLVSLRVGLVGFGLAGKTLHRPLIYAAGMTITAVVTRDGAAVATLAPSATAVASIEDLLARADVDLVVIVSPSHLHVAHATAALESGRHVVVDKPFAGVQSAVMLL
jgi:scyllo-inositol 2-dehydrogenase (NADP+)